MALTQIRDLELEIDLPYRGDVEICIRARRETNVQNYDVCVNMYHSEARDDDNAKDFGQVDCLSAGLESLVQELAESHTDQHQTFTGRLIEKIGRAAIDAEQLFYDDYFEFVRRYKLDQCITDMAKLHIS
ncbi:hypothetical protein HII31_00522 [Pseudocercospora fuligena]|uniref:Uncharacterized protein n=1 Tax=Pseudocercospora fuligena TaxID=685502 RepID=A0A8H6RTK9_9PEZI|nr:hypothetical protein HII31_00522 [Pseudocercospora fuligena]